LNRAGWAERIALPSGIVGATAQEAYEIPDDSVPQSVHDRVARRINQFIDPSRFEALIDVDVAVRRNHREFIGAVVQPSTDLLVAKAPFLRTYGLTGIVGITPARERSLGVVQAYCRIADCRDLTAERKGLDAV